MINKEENKSRICGKNRQCHQGYKVFSAASSSFFLAAFQRMLDLMRACRINSPWLILQRVTRLENSAYSSSFKRVLITRWRWGILYLFMAVNLLSLAAKASVIINGANLKKAGFGWQPQQDFHKTK